MERQLRPRRQGVPADHNYFAPYPNTIYTPPPACKQTQPDEDCEDIENIDENTLKTRTKKSPTQPTQPDEDCEDITNIDENTLPTSTKKSPSKALKPSTIDTNKVKKRWRYFGYRRKRKSIIMGFEDSVKPTLAESCLPQSGIPLKKRTRDLIPSTFTSQSAMDGRMEAEDQSELPKCDCCSRWRLSRRDRRQSQRLVIKNYKLPFNELPDLCKLAVFSFLSASEKGKAAQVCEEWRLLMRYPGLWSHLDFNEFTPPRYNLVHRGFTCAMYPWFVTSSDYKKYCTRLGKYFLLLQDLVPHVRYMRFAFDIANPNEDWLKHLTQLLQRGNYTELKVLDMDWTATAVRPPHTDQYCCFFNKIRMALKAHIKRVIIFHKFFDQLTKATPLTEQASLPFNWSERSVLLLCRWKNLTVLRLDSYTQLELMQQELLNVLLNKLQHLQKLKLSVCSPFIDTAEKRNFYFINHPQLKELDVSDCKGIFLRSLDTPALKVMKTGQHPWFALGGSTGRCFFPPCLHFVLQTGAPNLAYFNNHRLLDFWLEYPYEEMQRVLKRSCPCKLHSRRTID